MYRTETFELHVKQNCTRQFQQENMHQMAAWRERKDKDLCQLSESVSRHGDVAQICVMW